MASQWGIWGGIISFFGGAILMVWMLGFQEAFSGGLWDFIKACFEWAVFGFIFGVSFRKWLFRTFWV